jgi:hypothetical protein
MKTGLVIERFEYVRHGDQLAVVRLVADLGAERWAPDAAALTVGFGRYATLSPVRDCSVERPPRRGFSRSRSGLLWSASFAVALEVVEHPSAIFELTAPGCAAIALPSPGLELLSAAGARDLRHGRMPIGNLRVRLVAAATTLAVSAASTPALALAAAPSTPAPSTRAPSTRARARTATGSPLHRERLSLMGTRQRPAVHELKPPAARARVFSTPAPAPRATGKPTPVPAPTPPPRATGKPFPLRVPAPTPRATGKPVPVRVPAPVRPPAPPPAHVRKPPPVRKPAPVRKPPPMRKPAPSGGVGIAAPAPVPAEVQAPAVTSAPAPLVSAHSFRLPSSMLASGAQPPAFLIPIYKAAGRRYHVPWRVLAAINKIETDYGRNVNTSSAGAIGWMQFMPATWSEYGVDVTRKGRLDRGGRPDPYRPRDAIFSAARYLAANGAKRDVRGAIFAYNHAGWYVDEVLQTAKGITGLKGVRLKLHAMRATARQLNGAPYVWGGGHGSWGTSLGYDCSGFVSAVLHAAGYLTMPVTTQALPSDAGIVAGRGRLVTILDRTDAGGQDHVIVDLGGEWWASGGSSTAGGGASVHRLIDVSPAYLASFNLILHPRGM